LCTHHLLALDREDARKHTLSQASAQDDNIVLGCDLVHVCGCMDRIDSVEGLRRAKDKGDGRCLLGGLLAVTIAPLRAGLLCG
jgi:hypothetical protein